MTSFQNVTFKPKDPTVTSTALLVLGFQNSTWTHHLPRHPHCSPGQACSPLLTPITVSPCFAFGYAAPHTCMSSSLFLCGYLSPARPSALSRVSPPTRSFVAHIHLSVLGILVLLLQLLAPIFCHLILLEWFYAEPFSLPRGFLTFGFLSTSQARPNSSSQKGAQTVS